MGESREDLKVLCVVCAKDPNPTGHPSKIEVPPVLESFRPSPILERTLEILWKGAVDPNSPYLDKATLYSVLTNPGGAFCCFACSVILNKGLEIAAQILQLENCLENLGHDIFCANSNLSLPSVSKYSRINSHNSRPTLNQTLPIPSPQNNKKSAHDIFSRFRTKMETCTKCKCKLDSKFTSKSTKARKISRNTSQKASISECERTNCKITYSPLSERIHIKYPGVHKCPSCSFSVDIRNPSQKNLPLSSLSKADRRKLRSMAKGRVATHFQAKHIPSEANRKHLLPDGKKVFLCPSSPKCSYRSVKYDNVIFHYMDTHAPEKHLRDEDRLHCPEKFCTYETNITVLSNGTRGNDSVRAAKHRLAIHVFREHDIPSRKPSFEIVESPRKLSVVVAHRVQVEGGTTTKIVNAYRCTRCNYIDIPDKFLAFDKIKRRNKFLMHFFDAHLKNQVKIKYLRNFKRVN